MISAKLGIYRTIIGINNKRYLILSFYKLNLDSDSIFIDIKNIVQFHIFVIFYLNTRAYYNLLQF